MPPGEPTQSAVHIHKISAHDPRLVRDPVAVGVKAAARDPHERPAAGLSEVEGALDAVYQHRAGGDGLEWDPEHAREVVAAPAGKHAEAAVGMPKRVGDRADEPVA